MARASRMQHAPATSSARSPAEKIRAQSVFTCGTAASRSSTLATSSARICSAWCALRTLLVRSTRYLVTHHGNADTNVEPVLAAFRPQVAVVNNGAYKGGSPSTWVSLRQHKDIEDVWQLHKSLIDGSDNFPDTFIANLDFGPRDQGAWIKLSANDDGSFAVTNGRTGWTRRYDAR